MIARSVKVERIANTTILLTVLLAGLCAASGIGDAPSVLFGGAISYVNLRLIRLLVSRFMSPAAAGAPLSSLAAIKILFLLALLAVSLKRLPIEVVSFLVGTGTLFVAIVLDAVLLGERVDTREEDGASIRQQDQAD
ncbi:MAG: ATP synthase subunit I [Candidatus Binatia bacterium]